jgi:hypothetical protein
VILQDAAGLIEDAEDGELAALGLSPRSAWSPRHRQFTLMREVFFQDEDVLIAYDAGMADVAADPDHPVGQWLHAGDLRPPAWFATFANLRPRPAGRGFPEEVLAALRASSPALRFTTADPQDEAIPTSAVAVPPRLEASFELLVGLAQRRFFDRPCAVAMARTLCDLLVAFLDTPQLQPGRVWMLGQRATAGNEMLIVDDQFSIDGQTREWRLNADLSDRDARRWALGIVTDCAAKVITAYATRDPSLLLDMYGHTPPQVDPGLPRALSTRATALATRTTLAGFLTHRRSQLGLTVPQVAQAALLPHQVIAGWEAGAEATPTQYSAAHRRCNYPRTFCWQPTPAHATAPSGRYRAHRRVWNRATNLPARRSTQYLPIAAAHSYGLHHAAARRPVTRGRRIVRRNPPSVLIVRSRVEAGDQDAGT